MGKGFFQSDESCILCGIDSLDTCHSEISKSVLILFFIYIEQKGRYR